MRATAPRRWEHWVWPAMTAAVLLAVWQAAVEMTGTTVFPSPRAVEHAFRELLAGGVLWRYIGDSLRRVAIGYMAAAATAIPAGLLLGWYPALAQTVNPAIQIIRPISPIAWIPIAVVLFGIGDSAAIWLIFIGAFFPIIVSTMDGVRNVPSIYRRAGRNFGLSPLRLLARVVLPAALPRMLVGLRIALGIGWLVVVAAEMIAVDSGLGYLVIDARNSGKRYDLVVAAMLIIGVIGLALDGAMRSTTRFKALRWAFRHGA
jgi:NitT/TauT family transport system permease protein